MGDVTSHIDARAAETMLEAFTSVGAERFDLTLTDLEGQKLRFRKGLTSPELGRQLPRLLAEATPRMHNVIIRPHATAATLIQLDDLAVAAIERVLPVAFLTHETSPGNHQAWVAVSAGADADFARRLRKGAGADPTASGATRIAGSLNFKPKYAPDFPRVEIRHLAPRRVSRTDELQALGLVAAPEAAPVPSSRVSQAARPPRLAELRTLPRGRAAQSRRHRPGYQLGRLHLGDDGD
jgi:hypothetical protein